MLSLIHHCQQGNPTKRGENHYSRIKTDGARDSQKQHLPAAQHELGTRPWTRLKAPSNSYFENIEERERKLRWEQIEYDFLINKERKLFELRELLIMDKNGTGRQRVIQYLTAFNILTKEKIFLEFFRRNKL